VNSGAGRQAGGETGSAAGAGKQLRFTSLSLENEIKKNSLLLSRELVFLILFSREDFSYVTELS
jgi:hypothetical protein